MVGTLKRFTKRIFVLATILLAAVYTATCLIPYLNPAKYWVIGVLGLGFPITTLIMVVLLIFWLILRSRWAWLPLVMLIIGYQQISAFFATSLPAEFKKEKKGNTLRILDWNVSHWDEYNKNRKNGQTYRDKMMELIKAQNADILCFQEFFESHSPHDFKSNIPELQAMGFEHYYFAEESSRYYGAFQVGIAIFSKYPIVDSSRFKFTAGSAAESVISADIQVGDTIIRVHTTHLQSVRFDQKDYQGLHRIKNTEDSALEASKTIFTKLKKAYQYRNVQAKEVRSRINASPYPVIVCGDFNDTPNSYTYFTIRGNLRDAFIDAGSGIGRTFRYLSPTLRIDYILADKYFRAAQYVRYKVPYSDHYPIVADLEFPH